MGLDTILLARNQAKIETESCYALSRTFCRLLCDLVDLDTGIPELLQLFDLYQVKGDPVVQANVWETDQRILYRAEPGLTKLEVDAYHEASWQKAEALLLSLSQLQHNMEAAPAHLKKLSFNYNWISGYFLGVYSPEQKANKSPHFGNDLNNLIQFLRNLETNSEVRFHFF